MSKTHIDNNINNNNKISNNNINIKSFGCKNML